MKDYTLKNNRSIKCGHCNKKFTRTHHAKQYCSKECVQKNRNINQRSEPRILGIIKCRQCNRKFIPSCYRKKYCSETCSKKANKENIKRLHLSDKRKAYIKIYYQSDKRKAYLKEYKQSDSGKKTNTKYKQSDQGKKIRRDRESRDYNSKPLIRLKQIVRARLGHFLRTKNMKKTNSTFKMVGCTPEFLKEYLEKQFKPWMNWKNHTRKGWHIDHITPLDSAKTPKALEKLMHYTNLRPLRGTDNMSKGNRII